MLTMLGEDIMLKKVVLCGIDSTGKSTLAEFLQKNIPNTVVRKYPNDEEIKTNINNYYQRLANSGRELHEETVLNMYKQIHDLYDRDFRMPFSVPEDTELLLFDRYYIDNVVYSAMNGVLKNFYSENHLVAPDLIILLKARNYGDYKRKFKLKGDENIREPVILYEEVQPLFQHTLKQLQEQKRIKRYTIIEALTPTTNENALEIIKSL